MGILPKTPLTAFIPAFPKSLTPSLPGAFCSPPLNSAPLGAVLDAKELAPGLAVI